MKMNNKILVSALALAMGATLAGSISGTVAWFQYSTRVQAAYIGSSAHCSEALEVTCDGGTTWKTELLASEMNTNKVGGDALEPISTGNYAGTTALPALYKNPIYQIEDSANWGAATSDNYVQFNLQFHVKDINGANSASYLAKNLYLTDLKIVSTNGADLTKAIRVHFNINNSSYKLFANDGSEAGTVVTNTSGKLDLNNNGVLDKTAGYTDLGDTRTDITYGSGTQTALNASGTSVLADDSNPNSVTANQGLLGAIPANEAGLSVTVTMWIEGWTKLATGEDDNAQTSDTAVWKAATYANKDFKVGMRFGTDAHVAH